MWSDKKWDVGECIDIYEENYLLKWPKAKLYKTNKKKDIGTMVGVIFSKIQVNWEDSRDNKGEKVLRTTFYRSIFFVTSALWLHAYM